MGAGRACQYEHGDAEHLPCQSVSAGSNSPCLQALRCCQLQAVQLPKPEADRPVRQLPLVALQRHRCARSCSWRPLLQSLQRSTDACSVRQSPLGWQPRFCPRHWQLHRKRQEKQQTLLSGGQRGQSRAGHTACATDVTRQGLHNSHLCQIHASASPDPPAPAARQCRVASRVACCCRLRRRRLTTRARTAGKAGILRAQAAGILRRQASPPAQPTRHVLLYKLAHMPAACCAPVATASAAATPATTPTMMPVLDDEALSGAPCWSAGGAENTGSSTPTYSTAAPLTGTPGREENGGAGVVGWGGGGGKLRMGVGG